MRFNIQALENEIATALQLGLGEDYIVDVNPEDIDEFSTPFEKPRVWVGYQQSDYGELQVTRAVVQDETVTFCVTLQSRTLRDEGGIYEMKGKIFDLLAGKTPADCWQRIYPDYFGPPKHEDVLTIDCWTYEYWFKTATKAVQAYPDEDTVLIPNYKCSTFTGPYKEVFDKAFDNTFDRTNDET